MQIILSLILHPEIAGASAPQRERERAGMTGTGRVLTAVSFMGPVTISSCSEIRETEREERWEETENYVLVKCTKFRDK